MGEKWGRGRQEDEDLAGAAGGCPRRRSPRRDPALPPRHGVTPSLASAALACKSWGRVARVPAIFRRFDSLRRPQLVGFILSDRSDMPVPYHRPNLCFVSAKSRNPDAASAAADGDFFFEDLPDTDPAGDEDDRHYCDGGLLLLARGRDAV
ncbi:hypothetical protein ACQ4PT_001931 [Festuca glaucescens]